MPASLVLKKSIGINAREPRAVGDEIALTTLDSANIIPGNAPIGRPGTGYSYSFETWLFLEVETPPENGVNNFRFWSSGSDPDVGIKLYVGTAYSSSTPTDSKSTIADTSAAWYSGPDDSLLWWGGTLTNEGDKTKALVIQLEVSSSATLGTLYNENCVYHWSYDEW